MGTPSSIMFYIYYYYLSLVLNTWYDHSGSSAYEKGQGQSPKDWNTPILARRSSFFQQGNSILLAQLPKVAW